MLLCQVIRSDNVIKVQRARRMPLSEMALWCKTAKLDGAAAITVLDPGQYAILQVDAPAVPREEWRAALQWQLKDLLPFPVEGACVDLLEIPTEQFAPGRQQQCYAIAAQREAVTGVVQPLIKTGVDLQVVDVPELAQRNVGALFEEENRAVAFLAFSDSGALLTVTFHGELYGYRRIEVSLSNIVSDDEFRRQQALDRIALETQRTLDAFDRQYNFMTVTRLVLAAPPAAFDGLQSALAGNLYIPVAAMDLAPLLDISATPELIDPAVQLKFLTVIGAALRADET